MINHVDVDVADLMSRSPMHVRLRGIGLLRWRLYVASALIWCAARCAGVGIEFNYEGRDID